MKKLLKIGLSSLAAVIFAITTVSAFAMGEQGGNKPPNTPNRVFFQITNGSNQVIYVSKTHGRGGIIGKPVFSVVSPRNIGSFQDVTKQNNKVSKGPSSFLRVLPGGILKVAYQPYSGYYPEDVGQTTADHVKVDIITKNGGQYSLVATLKLRLYIKYITNLGYSQYSMWTGVKIMGKHSNWHITSTVTTEHHYIGTLTK